MKRRQKIGNIVQRYLVWEISNETQGRPFAVTRFHCQFIGTWVLVIMCWLHLIEPLDALPARVGIRHRFHRYAGLW